MSTKPCFLRKILGDRSTYHSLHPCIPKECNGILLHVEREFCNRNSYSSCWSCKRIEAIPFHRRWLDCAHHVGWYTRSHPFAGLYITVEFQFPTELLAEMVGLHIPAMNELVEKVSIIPMPYSVQLECATRDATVVCSVYRNSGFLLAESQSILDVQTHFP